MCFACKKGYSKGFLELIDFGLPVLCACAHVIWSDSALHLLLREFNWLLTQPTGLLLSRLKDSINGLSACIFKWLNVSFCGKSTSEQISLTTHMPCRLYKSFCSCATQLCEISMLWAFGVLQTVMFNVLERFRSGLPFCSLMRAVICFLLHCCSHVSTAPWVAAVILPSKCQDILFTF